MAVKPHGHVIEPCEHEEQRGRYRTFDLSGALGVGSGKSYQFMRCNSPFCMDAEKIVRMPCRFDCGHEHKFTPVEIDGFHMIDRCEVCSCDKRHVDAQDRLDKLTKRYGQLVEDMQQVFGPDGIDMIAKRAEKMREEEAENDAGCPCCR